MFPMKPDEHSGCMILITRIADSLYTAKIFATVFFIPCIGARDTQASESLAAALAAGKHKDVRSLHRNSALDETAWCIGTDWWLSTAEVV